MSLLSKRENVRKFEANHQLPVASVALIYASRSLPHIMSFNVYGFLITNSVLLLPPIDVEAGEKYFVSFLCFVLTGRLSNS